MSARALLIAGLVILTAFLAFSHAAEVVQQRLVFQPRTVE